MQAKKWLSLFWQEKGVLIKKCKENFKAYITTTESYGGYIGYGEGQIEEEMKKSAVDADNSSEQEIKDKKLVGKNGMLVMMFISGAKNNLTGNLNTELINDFTKGIDNLLINLEDMVQPMITYHVKKGQKLKTMAMKSEMAFAQQEEGSED